MNIIDATVIWKYNLIFMCTLALSVDIWVFKVLMKGNFCLIFLLFYEKVLFKWWRMKSTVYLYLIRTVYILSSDVTSLTRTGGNNKKMWYLGNCLIKFNETWHKYLVGAMKWTIWLIYMVVMATHPSPVPSLRISIWSISKLCTKSLVPTWIITFENDSFNIIEFSFPCTRSSPAIGITFCRPLTSSSDCKYVLPLSLQQAKFFTGVVFPILMKSCGT